MLLENQDGNSGSMDDSSPIAGMEFSSCKEIIEFDSNAASGEYTLTLTEQGVKSSFAVYCDMSANEGGWTLVLNYVHQGNTNPPQSIIHNISAYGQW